MQKIQSDIIVLALTKMFLNYEAPHGFELDGGKAIYLGSKKDLKCRFCKKGSPEVTFKSRAHAIPEFTGNKQLFSYYECDSCNSKFARLLETHMGDYMNISHTIYQVKGKNSVPSYRQGGKESRIDMTSEGLHIRSYNKDSYEMFPVDEQAKNITINGVRSPYIPIAVFKCLCKMALTIMDENEIKYFSSTIEWILEDSHTESRFKNINAHVIIGSLPAGMVFNGTNCFLLKRKETHTENVPYMTFLLEYGNYSFQIFLPLCSEDLKLHGLKTMIRSIPSNVEIFNQVSIRRDILDFSGSHKIKGEKVKSIVINFESMEENDYHPSLDDSVK